LVRAGSLKYGSSSPLVKRLLIAAAVVVIVFAIFFVGSKLFSGNSDDGSIETATTTSIPEELTNEINSIGFQVFQPQAILNNFFRTNVEIVTEARTRSDCKEVLQNYQGSENSAEAFIDVYSYSLDCPYPLPGDETPHTAGNYQGWISVPSSGEGDLLESILIELVVENSYVRIETDLPIEFIEETIRTFVPYSPVPPEDSLTITIS